MSRLKSFFQNVHVFKLSLNLNNSNKYDKGPPKGTFLWNNFKTWPMFLRRRFSKFSIKLYSKSLPYHCLRNLFTNKNGLKEFGRKQPPVHLWNTVLKSGWWFLRRFFKVFVLSRRVKTGYIFFRQCFLRGQHGLKEFDKGPIKEFFREIILYIRRVVSVEKIFKDFLYGFHSNQSFRII